MLIAVSQKVDQGKPLKISPMQREYLGEIYRLERSPEGVTTSALAERLEVSSSAVARMLRRLDQLGFLTHVPYQGVKLSPAGEREALRSIRRHRLLEVFLVKVMGFGWDEVHEESHGLQLTISDAFEDRMDALAADEIYHRARRARLDANLSTVYRNLATFCDMGWLDAVPGSNGERYYQVHASDEQRLSVLCLDCGQLTTLQAGAASPLNAAV